MTFGSRWSELRWALTWATSPAPLSWLLVGVAFAFGIWGLFALGALRHLSAETSQLAETRQQLIESARQGVPVVHTDGSTVWIAPRRPDSIPHDTVPRRPL